MNHININPSDVLAVLGYHNHDGDCECGDFKRNLITAMICAGPEDRARLTLGFPSLVAAIRSQTSNPSGIEYLEGIARSYERPLGQRRWPCDSSSRSTRRTAPRSPRHPSDAAGPLPAIRCPPRAPTLGNQAADVADPHRMTIAALARRGRLLLAEMRLQRLSQRAVMDTLLPRRGPQSNVFNWHERAFRRGRPPAS